MKQSPRPRYYPGQNIIIKRQCWNEDTEEYIDDGLVFAKILSGSCTVKSNEWVYDIEIMHPFETKESLVKRGYLFEDAVFESDIVGPANQKDELEFWIPPTTSPAS